MSVQVEALELEIERVYCQLGDKVSGRQTLWLTQCGTLRWAKHQPGTAVEIGTYTDAVQLADLRGDVFHIFEALKGRKHG